MGKQLVFDPFKQPVVFDPLRQPEKGTFDVAKVMHVMCKYLCKVNASV